MRVLTAQMRLWEKWEKEVVHFFIREFETLLDEAREKLAKFVDTKSEELAFETSATSGINGVLRSRKFS
ncbi:MAG: aminotransferase, partial [Okeania sp. SIO2D1]|nr:aminotransferase [Okeania sp. SIO2D1]